MEHTVEVYRFTWRSSFHGDAVVQVGRGGKNIILDGAAALPHPSGQTTAALARYLWRHPAL
jgi:hypothetical protein